MRSDTRVQGWALVGFVLVSWLLALLLGGGREAAQTPTSSSPALLAEGDAPVVLIGVPGLTWDLIDPGTTPTLDSLAHAGASAALVLRGTHEVTCAADAWLTVGAGQRAATDLTGCGDAPDEGRDSAEGGPDEDSSARGTSAGGTSAGGTSTGSSSTGGSSAAGELIVDGQIDPVRWQAWQAAADQRALGPRLGSLATIGEQVGCIAAYGPQAALGAADATGRVTAYHPLGLVPESEGGAVDPDLTVPTLDPSCRLHLVSTPPVLEGDQTRQLPQIDAGVEQLRDQLPRGSRIVVAGLGHTAGVAEAMALMVGSVPEADPLTLTSASTQQRELVQLTDLTVGLHQLLGQDWEGADLAGGELRVLDGGSDPVGSAQNLADAVTGAKVLAFGVLGGLFAFLLPALVGSRLLGWWGVLSVLGTVATAVPAATFLAGLVPWWRSPVPGPTLLLLILLLAGLVAGVAWAGPWRRHRIGPSAVVAAITMVVLGADVLVSSRLGLVSVLGLQPVTAGRFYGQGNVGFGVMLGCLLVVCAAVIAAISPGRQAATAVGLVGSAAVLVNAAPQGGADFGGVPALVIATGLMVLAALQVRWSFGTMLVLALAGAAVAGVVMVADWLRGPGARTHLGEFVQSVIDGEALGIVARKLDQSLGILIHYPASWLAVLALAAYAWVVVTRPAWSARIWTLPGVHAAGVAGAVTMALAWALNDSGIAAVGLALAILVTAGITLLSRRRLRADP